MTRHGQIEWEDVIEVEHPDRYFAADGSFVQTGFYKIEWVKVGNEVMKLLRPLDGNRIAVMRYGLRNDKA